MALLKLALRQGSKETVREGKEAVMEGREWAEGQTEQTQPWAQLNSRSNFSVLSAGKRVKDEGRGQGGEACSFIHLLSQPFIHFLDYVSYQW